jgi:septum site-determining protein MinD
VTRIVTVTSGKGGVGKTTTSASFSTGLAMRGFKTVVIDFDVGLRNLDLIMGCERRVVYDLINVVNGEATLNQALIKDKHCDNLFVLPASQTRDKDALSEEGVEKVLKDLTHMGFDYIVCDSPAGIEHGAVMALTFADEAIVVTNPEVSSVRDSDRILGILQAKSRRASKAASRSRNTCSSPATTRTASKPAKCCRTRTSRKSCASRSSASFRNPRKCCRPPTRVRQSFTRRKPMRPRPIRMSSPASWAKKACASSTTSSRACSSACSEASDMSLLSMLFGNKPKTAAVAKERLQLIIAHERDGASAVNFLPQLQRELIEVISKYVKVNRTTSVSPWKSRTATKCWK